MARRGDGRRVCAPEGDGLFAGDFDGCENVKVLVMIPNGKSVVYTSY